MPTPIPLVLSIAVSHAVVLSAGTAQYFFPTKLILFTLYFIFIFLKTVSFHSAFFYYNTLSYSHHMVNNSIFLGLFGSHVLLRCSTFN